LPVFTQGLKSFLDKRTDYLTKDIEVRTYTMRCPHDKTRP
jgi:hypothetical protein